MPPTRVLGYVREAERPVLSSAEGVKSCITHSFTEKMDGCRQINKAAPIAYASELTWSTWVHIKDGCQMTAHDG
jgi:hypothetical protein